MFGSHFLLNFSKIRKVKKTFGFLVLGVFFLSLLLSIDINPGNLEARYEKSQGSCDAIDIVIVCKGYNVSRDVATLAKSILFHRTRPIHLHFIADNIATNILSVLFDTWNVPYLDFSFHTAENVKLAVENISSSHPSSDAYGMVKLLLPQILPVSLEKVIVLDTHITFSLDVAGLWDLISTFSNEQVIGLVENQDNGYLEEAVSDSPSLLRKGFNTDVMALDLKKLRAISGLWRSVAHKYIAKNYDVHLTDEDVINAVIADNSHIVHKLPCIYNIQLSDHSQSEMCYSKLNTNMMIINWNSPSRQNVRHKHLKFFRDVYNTFVQLDGTLLRKPNIFCNIIHPLITEQPSEGISDLCSELNEVRNTKYRTHLFYFPYIAPANEEFDVTWVSQMSFDRIQMIEPLFRAWEGPISLALYFSDAEVELFQSFILYSEYLRSRTNIGYHIVFKQGTHHPINLLRNVALDQVGTPFVFLSDIDFLPGSDLYTNLKLTVEDLEVGNGNKALVIPAFNLLQHAIRQIKSKEEIISLLDNGYLSSFGEFFPPGHLPTNFTYWREATNPYQIKWAPLFEPYIVVRQNVTRYDTRFAGYGWNKISHSLELRAQNYEFIVLPDSFIVHQPHSRGVDNLKYKSSVTYRKCCGPLKSQFAQKLLSLYQYQVDEVALKGDC